MANTEEKLVLVTGGSGFLGAHCILQCLDAGYRVRTTVRSTKSEDNVRKMLKAGGATKLHLLTFTIADLLNDEGWREAAEGCTYVLHVASPYPAITPKHENELIIPARDGTLRVLRAARDAGVKRVVLTSSVAAIVYGIPLQKTPYTEELWTNVDSPDVPSYPKSKTIAERAAWDFIEKEGGSMELSVVNPAGIFGPVLGPDFATSVILVQRLLNGDVPGCPQLQFGVVDVRDVADLHCRAMTNPKAKGERFVAVSPPCMTIQQVSMVLRDRMGNAAKRSPTCVIPNFLTRLVALFDPEVANVISELGKPKDMSNEKAKNLLGWQPRTGADALVATAESLIEFGLVKAA
ncbi:hypothetical protein BP6252_13654 [Coleophoma cylindrospora]|uniref:NAD-dependent epimerase/dehydratase domain-containing protein n=1 Tax=Coleophoma cylindrospora TaxID=1849047 RepID=A0A3D8Q8T4_9HELO|nr:hypothetical protein BP6252_13654 [Coleophoma cylindrospora]